MTGKPKANNKKKSAPESKDKSKGKNKDKARADQLKIRDTIIRTALNLAARDGWGKVNLNTIAQEADIALSTVQAHFKDRDDILRAYEESIDARLLDSMGTGDEDATPREMLFDLLMERFDALNEQRAGMIAILDHSKCDPKLVARTMPHLGQAMAHLLEAADIDTTGLKGMAHIFGLTGVYLLTLKTWRDDESPDLSKTMAALDRNLGRAEQLGATLGII
ncbi:MAG TPA: TetR family transcriptional regulator [Micavibrio sp.]